jgi:hypothetical protein
MTLLERLLAKLRRFQNERLYRRVPVNVPVRVLPSAGDAFEAFLTNWSAGGVFISTERPPAMHALLDLEFSLGPSGQSRLKLRGQVVRSQQNAETVESTGVGVMFIDLSDAGLNILREFLLEESTRG